MKEKRCHRVAPSRILTPRHPWRGEGVTERNVLELCIQVSSRRLVSGRLSTSSTECDGWGPLAGMSRAPAAGKRKPQEDVPEPEDNYQQEESVLTESTDSSEDENAGLSVY